MVGDVATVAVTEDEPPVMYGRCGAPNSDDIVGGDNTAEGEEAAGGDDAAAVVAGEEDEVAVDKVVVETVEVDTFIDGAEAGRKEVANNDSACTCSVNVEEVEVVAVNEISFPQSNSTLPMKRKRGRPRKESSLKG